MAAAVADWRTEQRAGAKMKKAARQRPPELKLVENPDILAALGHAAAPARLVIGFAAETEALLSNAEAKLARKGADLIVANDVSQGVMGADKNRVAIIGKSGVETWPELTKVEVAERLAALIAARLATIEV